MCDGIALIPKATKKSSLRRVALGVLGGIALVAGLIWLLARTLGNSPQTTVAGKPMEYWQGQLNGHDVVASNEAFALVNSRVIPELTNAMFHDTNDSRLRLLLIDGLNELPGVQIYFTDAAGRRIQAAETIGELGASAKSAIPALIQALQGGDEAVHGAAISALGEIHSEPETIIPLLITYLDDSHLNDEAAKALGNYGVLAKAAVPKIVRLLRAPDKDARVAASAALQKIDPETYANAMQTPQTNRPAITR